MPSTPTSLEVDGRYIRSRTGRWDHGDPNALYHLVNLYQSPPERRTKYASLIRSRLPSHLARRILDWRTVRIAIYLPQLFERADLYQDSLPANEQATIPGTLQLSGAALSDSSSIPLPRGRSSGTQRPAAVAAT